VDALTAVKAFGAAWAEHDLEAALSLVTQDCVFDATGPAPNGVRHVGRSALRSAWQAIFDDPSSGFDVIDLFAQGNRCTSRWEMRWDGGYMRGVDIFTVRDGKVAEKLSYVKG